MKLSEKIQEALREQQEINLSDPAVQKRLAAQWGYVPAGAQDGIRWDLLPGWLIDHHEGAVLSEELLQRALAEMLAEMPKPEVQTALRERVMDAIAEALGDAYDCTRHWSAWGYGTMSQDDFSLVADDSDRIGEIADAAIGAIGAQNAPTIAEQDQINAEAAIRSIYGAQPAPSIAEQDQINAEAAIRSIYGAQPAPNLPVDLITDYLVSISAHVAHQDDPKAQAEIGELLRILAAAPEAKP